jgi:hypothetical protein
MNKYGIYPGTITVFGIPYMKFSTFVQQGRTPAHGFKAVNYATDTPRTTLPPLASSSIRDTSQGTTQSAKLQECEYYFVITTFTAGGYIVIHTLLLLHLLPEYFVITTFTAQGTLLLQHLLPGVACS